MRVSVLVALLGCAVLEDGRPSGCPESLSDAECAALPEPPETIPGERLAIEVARYGHYLYYGELPERLPPIEYEDRVRCLDGDIEGGGCIAGVARVRLSGQCRVTVIVDYWWYALPHELYHCWLYWATGDADGDHSEPVWGDYVDTRLREQMLELIGI